MQGLFRTEDGNFVNFKYDAVQNKFETEKQGRAIYRKVLFATVHSPGQSKSEITYEIEKEDSSGKMVPTQYYNKFAKQAEAWKNNNEASNLNGTPIEQWPALDVKMVATLKFNNIFTVEALAELSDSGLQKVGMGARELQEKAKAFLALAKDSAAAQKYAAENQELKDRIAELEKTVSDLSDKYAKKK